MFDKVIRRTLGGVPNNLASQEAEDSSSTGVAYRILAAIPMGTRRDRIHPPVNIHVYVVILHVRMYTHMQSCIYATNTHLLKRAPKGKRKDEKTSILVIVHFLLCPNRFWIINRWILMAHDSIRLLLCDYAFASGKRRIRFRRCAKDYVVVCIMGLRLSA